MKINEIEHLTEGEKEQFNINLLGDDISTQVKTFYGTKKTRDILGNNICTQINTTKNNIEICEYDGSNILGAEYCDYDTCGGNCPSDCGTNCGINCPSYCAAVCTLNCEDCPSDYCPDCACNACNYPDCSDDNPCDTSPCDTSPCDTSPCDTSPCDTSPCDTSPCDTSPCDTCSCDLYDIACGIRDLCPSYVSCPSNYVSYYNVYWYYAFIPQGFVSKDGKYYTYEINWLNSQNCEYTTDDSYPFEISETNILSSTTINNNNILFFIFEGKYVRVSNYAETTIITDDSCNLTISIPGHEKITKNIKLFQVIGEDFNTAKNNLLVAIADGTFKHDIINVTPKLTKLSLVSSANISNNNTKYTSVKYIFSNPNAVTTSGMSYTLYKSENEICLSTLNIYSPFQNINVARTRTGLNYTSNSNFSLSLTGNSISYEDLPTPTIQTKGEVMTFSDMAEMFPNTNLNNISSQNTSNLCVVPEFSKTSILPFGLKMSKSYANNEVMLPEHILGFYGITDTSKFFGEEWKLFNVDVDLNGTWKPSNIYNPDINLYEVYESFSANTSDDYIGHMTITINGYTNFKLYIRQNDSGTNRYIMASKLDKSVSAATYNDSNVQAHTRSTENKNTDLDAYTLVEYTNIDGKQHTINIAMRYNSSINDTYTGYILIPKSQNLQQNIYVTPTLYEKPKKYTLNLNNQWQSSTITNPNSSLYDGVYQSFSNAGVDSSGAIMYIDIEGYNNFKLYIRSYAEGNYDYVMVSQLDQIIDEDYDYDDTEFVKAHTRGNQQPGADLASYTLVEFTNIDGGEHRITVVYRKDSSYADGDDRGYILIPKNQ